MIITRDEAIKLREVIEKAVPYLDDETALQGVTLFPSWKVDTAYIAGTKVKFNDVLYTVLQDHTSQVGWTPDVAPSLFAKVLIPDENVIPAWEQPDSINGYSIGNKVSHNGKIWESLVDNNVWEPDTVGTESVWAEVIE